MTLQPDPAPPTITDPASVIEVLVALLASAQPAWAESAYRQLVELSLEIAAGRASLPERQYQAVEQLRSVLEAFRPDAGAQPPRAGDPTLADVRALLAAFQRGGAR